MKRKTLHYVLGESTNNRGGCLQFKTPEGPRQGGRLDKIDDGITSRPIHHLHECLREAGLAREPLPVEPLELRHERQHVDDLGLP